MAPQGKRKPESAEATGLTEPSGLPGPPDSESREASSADDKEAGHGESKAVRNQLLEYPPLGEVQLRGVHSNARSLVRLHGRS